MDDPRLTSCSGVVVITITSPTVRWRAQERLHPRRRYSDGTRSKADVRCIMAATRRRVQMADAEELRSALEQRQDHLRRLVGNRQGLYAKLLLGLQRRQLRAFLGEVSINEIANTRFK